ncbi:glycosyltransferase [Cryobacterium sp. CG_9.6]|uniref:glycosyltransferase n=1 Tax=Cryobacterium sp. CG_9.6 TaxID=2760710 RepID=UPI002475E1B4|nr:glycosyltransferase [Cryobacterium sp. CG_9.6]MDH6235809.1 glycosyltransferase involved in cell wall biosynthesis [Cryobacterium sp. CG_9.6]
MNRQRIVQHSFGSIGSGGPIGALARVMNSQITGEFEFRHVAQPAAAGGVNLRLVRRMARQMRDFHPHLAHIRGLGNEGFHGVLAARLAGVPRILVSVHGSVRDLVHGRGSTRRALVGWVLEPLTLRLATHVVTVCEDALDKPVLAPVWRKVVGVVPNGVEVVRSSTADQRRRVRRELNIQPHDVALICVGRLVLDKGQVDLLAALDGLTPLPGAIVHVLLVGDGPDRAPIARAAASVSSSNRVHLLGQRDDVPALLAAADVAVFPTLHENLSNALLEAMAAALPIVATRVGGNTEVLRNGGGVLVPPGDPFALAAALQTLIVDAELRTVVGQAARATVENGYTTGHMVARLAQVYRAILAADRRGSVARGPEPEPRVLLLGFTINDKVLSAIAAISPAPPFKPTTSPGTSWERCNRPAPRCRSCRFCRYPTTPNTPGFSCVPHVFTTRASARMAAASASST